MIRQPLWLLGILVLTEAAILWLASLPRFKKFFSVIPSVFWIYFVPLLLSNLGWIDSQAEIYKILSQYVLPASLILLLIPSDIPSILKLGSLPLLMMAAGSLGIMIGMPISFWLVKDWVGSEMWSGFGALSSSWIGGSANMVAVKESLGTPEAVFAPMVIVDTIVPYAWMGLLIALAGTQRYFNFWTRADRRMIRKMKEKANTRDVNSTRGQVATTCPLVSLLMLSAAGILSFTLSKAASHFPIIPDVISAYTWTILLASALGIALSFTPAKNLEKHGITQLGYWLLYLVLTSIGARAVLSGFHSVTILVLAGTITVIIHALILLIAAKILKAPMFLFATASQANLGGAASAPVVAEVYHPGLAPTGLLMAVAGNIAGTWLGLITSQLCRALV